jgi:hypothetical protein
MFKFFAWRVTPLRVTSRVYLKRQLKYQGVPEGRLPYACVQDLADFAVDNAKVTAALRRLRWHEIVTDHLDIVALNVWRLLCRPDDPLQGAIADKCRHILAEHGALSI